MTMRNALTYERACELLRYEQDAGKLFWKKDAGARAKAGNVAGFMDGSGYVSIKIDRVLYRAHRVIWLLQTGRFPEKFIDHVNGVKNDNRWSNIREATPSKNAANTGARSNCKSGTKGVTLADGRYVVQCKAAGKKRYWASFATLDEATHAYRIKASEYFGDFARVTQ